MTHNDHVHFTHTYTPPTFYTYAQGGVMYARPVGTNTWIYMGYLDEAPPKVRRRQTW